MTLDISAEPETTIPIPAMRPTREQAKALAEIKQRLRPGSLAGAFYQEVIGHGLAAIQHAKAPPETDAAADSRDRSGDSNAVITAKLNAANEELRALRKVAAEAKTMAAMVNDQAAEIERLRAHAPAVATMSGDDMIRAALAGVVAHARKGDSARNALEALEAIKYAIGAPDLATAIADAAKYREARLITLRTHRENGPANPRKSKASDDSEAT